MEAAAQASQQGELESVMRLPDIKYAIKKGKSAIVQMRGINFSDAIQDGDLAESLNLSARRWPYITTRNKREKQEGYTNVTALTAWDKLIAVVGTNLYYGENIVGTVTAGEKQFAVVNTKLVIWPDKKYLDLSTLALKDLGAEKTGTSCTFTTSTMTVTWAGDLRDKFNVGDCIEISGCTSVTANNKSIVIQELTATVITVTEDGFAEGTETGNIKIERKIPDLDFICESENRLWGCSNSDRTIYASSLGDPTNFFTYEGVATDSYALAVGSEGDFTGCCKLASSVLFWKETTLHKMLGSYPAEYSLITYTLEGLQKGCHKSMQVINEVLFYVGLHGVFAYSGGTPTLISANFGNKDFSAGVAGNDGDTYYLSVTENGKTYLLVYETKQGIWVMEDTIRCKDFARIGKNLYLLDDKGDVWLADGGEGDPNMEWYAQFTPFYETIEGRKVYSKILLRLQLPEGSHMTASIRTDGQRWDEVGRASGCEDVIPMRIGLNRCDKFEIRLAGKGPCTVLSMLREFREGSEV